jgi:hypothetical protein
MLLLLPTAPSPLEFAASSPSPSRGKRKGKRCLYPVASRMVSTSTLLPTTSRQQHGLVSAARRSDDSEVGDKHSKTHTRTHTHCGLYCLHRQPHAFTPGNHTRSTRSWPAGQRRTVFKIHSVALGRRQGRLVKVDGWQRRVVRKAGVAPDPRPQRPLPFSVTVEVRHGLVWW